MHAYLVVSNNHQEALVEARELAARKKNEDIYEFSITKIDEVRKLISFTKFSFNKPTAIIISDIQNATEEALNAFLKNLEEPQKNLSYILTASSEEKLIPTIVSRCQVIRVKSNKNKVPSTKDLENFLDMSVGEKFTCLDAIKKRDEAVDFTENLTYIWHTLLVEGKGNLQQLSRSLKLAENTYKNLQANGNVNLQLTNFAIQLGLPETKNQV